MMQQDYEHTEHVQDLMEALARAQAHMKNPIADSTNPHLRARYPSLAVVRDAVMPALAAEGIALTQLPITSDTHGGCVTILWCKDQYLKSTLRLPVTKADPQGYGSAITYARRYALLAICNIASDDDDDGEKATDRAGGTTQRKPTPERPSHPARREPEPPMADVPRQALLREIHELYNRAIVPLDHAGMYKAIFFHSFGIEKPQDIKQQSLETLEHGLPLYRRLTDVIDTWDKQARPDVWVAEQQRRLAAEARPEDVDLTAGELRDMPQGWLTEKEQAALRAQDDAALLEQATT